MNSNDKEQGWKALANLCHRCKKHKYCYSHGGKVLEEEGYCIEMSVLCLILLEEPLCADTNVHLDYVPAYVSEKFRYKL